MNIYALELDNDIKGISTRKQYIEALIAKTYLMEERSTSNYTNRRTAILRIVG